MADGNTGLAVGRTAARLGVTVRTLHHWDEIGLARPSLRSNAGYRLYTAADLERLHRIVVYRELGLELGTIKDVLDGQGADTVAALRSQRALLSDRIDQLQHLGSDLDRMIAAHEQGPLLSTDQQADILGPQWDPEWAARARQHYGDTTQWQQYAERSATRTPADWRRVTEAMQSLERALADASASGITPGSPEANDLVGRHRRVFSDCFFPLTLQMQVCLGRMYEADPGFADYYESIRPGLARWLRSSIDAAARANGVDPDTATWQ